METFTEFEHQAAAPQRNFSDILSHAFNTYFKIIGWCMLGFVIYIMISYIFSYFTEAITDYDSEAMAEELRDMAESGRSEEFFSSMLGTPGFKFSLGVNSLASIILAPFFTGFIYLMHRANTGLAVQFSDLFVGFRENYLQYVIYALISTIGFSIGFLLCGIGFFFVLPFFFCGIAIILFEKSNAIDALKKSFNIGKENYSTLLGVGFIVSIIAFAGIILCGIGIIATLPFFYAAMYSAYIAFNGVPQIQHSDHKM